jgi:hypothetical protein
MVDYTEEQELQEIQEAAKKIFEDDVRGLYNMYMSWTKEKLEKHYDEISEKQGETPDVLEWTPYWVGYKIQKMLIKRALKNK